MSAASEHLPALIVAVPLMTAPVIVAIRHSGAAWALAAAASLGCFLMSLALLGRVLDTGAFSYLMGGWAAPWGIEYRIDHASAFVMLIVSAIASVAAFYARISAAAEIPQERLYLFYAMFVLCLCGMLGMTITGDAFNLFVFLEISSLSTYVLIGLGRDRRALTASLRYLILGTVGATFYVVGIGLAYMMTGTLNMDDLAHRLAGAAHTSTVQASLAFLVVGIGLKMAAFPLHSWLPNAYAYAPSSAAAFLAGTATKVSVYVFLRIVLDIYGDAGMLTELPVLPVLTAMALAGMFIGSAAAIWQSDVKRSLAYSSTAQIGYILLGASMLSETGLAAAVVHLFNHAIMKTALFLALGAIVLQTGSVRLEDLKGIGRRMPLTMAAFLIAGLSLIGLPLTVGFVSKWYLVEAALDSGMWPAAILILSSSLLAVVYIWRIVETAWFAKPAEGVEIREAPAGLLIPIWVLAGACIWFGTDASGVMDIARTAAQSLMIQPAAIGAVQ